MAPCPCPCPAASPATQLGAPTVAMGYGLRLAFVVVQSKLILSTTVIQKPVQVGRFADHAWTTGLWH